MGLQRALQSMKTVSWILSSDTHTLIYLTFIIIVAVLCRFLKLNRSEDEMTTSLEARLVHRQQKLSLAFPLPLPQSIVSWSVLWFRFFSTNVQVRVFHSPTTTRAKLIRLKDQRCEWRRTTRNSLGYCSPIRTNGWTQHSIIWLASPYNEWKIIFSP